MRRHLLFFLALLALRTSLVEAQNTTLPLCTPLDMTGKIFLIDATTGSSTSKLQYGLKDQVRVIVINENRLVNSYKLTVTPQEVSEVGLTSFLGSFGFTQAILGTAPASDTAKRASAPAVSSALAGPPGGISSLQRNMASGAQKSKGGPDCSKELTPLKLGEAQRIDELASDIKDGDNDLTSLVKGLQDSLSSVASNVAPLQAKMASPSIACTDLRPAIQSFLEAVSDVDKKLATDNVRKALRDHEHDLVEQENLLRHFRRGFSSTCLGTVLDWLGDYQAQLDAAKAHLAKLSASVDDIEKGRDALMKQRAVVQIAMSNTNAFFEERPLVPYNLPTNVTVTLEITANTPASAAAVTKGPWVLNFGGQARFTISAGIAWSGLEDRTFKAVQSTETQTAEGSTEATTVQKVGFDKDSSSRTTPLVLLNTRIGTVWTLKGSAVDLHASFGLSAKVQDSSTTAEYLAGFSLGLAENRFFLTVGGYYGNVTKLEGGFTPGSTLPADVKSPPVHQEKHWKPGFALTYKLK